MKHTEIESGQTITVTPSRIDPKRVRFYVETAEAVGNIGGVLVTGYRVNLKTGAFIGQPTSMLIYQSAKVELVN